MSTKIGIITEGAIDDLLLPALLERIARERANFTWPVMPDDLGQVIPLRKRGHGGVVEAVQRLVTYLNRSRRHWDTGFATEPQRHREDEWEKRRLY